MYTNDLGERIVIDYSIYNILTTVSKLYDKIVNPFDLNISKNNPYNDEEKNNSCFLELKTEYQNILLIFKTKEIPKIVKE